MLLIASCGKTLGEDDAPTDAGRANPEVDASGVATDGAKLPVDDASGGMDAGDTKIVFISAGTFSVETTSEPTPRADAVCDAEGKTLKPGSTFKAWFSTTAQDAKDVISAGRYVRADGVTIVAFSKVQLLSGNLAAPISTTLDGAATDATPWTGTKPNGTLGENCLDWTSKSEELYGHAGDPTAKNGGWSAGVVRRCSEKHRLLCFEL